MRRSDSVVECDFRSVVDALMTSRGFAISVAEASDFEVVSLLGAREDWKCVRSACVVLVRSISVRRSFGFDIATGLLSKTLDRSCFLSDIKMADNMCVVHKPKTLDCIKILVGQ